MKPPTRWDKSLRRFVPIARVTCPDCNTSLIWETWTRCIPCERHRNLTRYRIIRRATAAVSAAIKAGRLQRPTGFACKDCGKPATEYDHRDYSKPLEVEPVCHPCNLRRGPGLNAYEAVA